MSAYRLLTAAIATVLLAGCETSENTTPPVARFSHSCVEFVCTFDASETIGRSDGTLFYSWDFGDDQVAGGKIVTHAYATTGQMKVTLVASTNDGTSSIEKEIAVTGNPAAKYYNIVHDSFGLMLLMADIMPAIQTTGDALQEAVETHGAPLGNPYLLECAYGGTARITSWTDTNNSLDIDDNEALEFEAANCSFTNANDALTTFGVARISGDFDSNSFSVGKTTVGLSALRSARAPRWPIQGLVPVTVTRSAGTIETISFNSDTLRTYRTGSNGNIELSISTPVDLSMDFAAATGIEGNLAVDFTQGSTSYHTEIQQPIDIINSAGELRMQTGSINITFDGDIVAVTPDADPDYVQIIVDHDSDGDTDITTRFLQSLVVQRLAN